MSIGADWRQISPGSAEGVANNKFASSNAAGKLVDGAEEGRGFSEYMFGKDGFEFTDFLDVINPLQHIPVVGMLYRSITGDELGNGARVVGGGLFGGVFGLAGAAVDAVVDLATGEDTGEHIMAMFDGGDTPADQPVMADASAGAANSGASGLVLPWNVGDRSMAAMSGQPVNPAEQATITDTAPVTGVETLAMNAQAGAAGVTGYYDAAGLVMPWAANPQTVAQTMASNVAPSAVAPSIVATTPQMPFSQTAENPAMQAAQRLLAEAGDDVANPMNASLTNPNTQDADPAELAVAMARAGQADLASNMTMRTADASGTGQQATIQQASFSRDNGNSVWSRAQNSGRVSRGTPQFSISPEIATRDAKLAKLNQADVAKSDVSSEKTGQTPLSAAEMAARFNAALGSERAQTMASEALASTNAVAQDNNGDKRGAMTDQNRNVVQNNSASDAETVHPLMERAQSDVQGDAPVGPWFSQTMMDGLKKYQAMQQQNLHPSGNSI